MRAVTKVVWALAGIVIVGCKASLQAEGSANVEIANERHVDAEGAGSRRFGTAEEQLLADDPITGSQVSQSPAGTALIGARHDLKLAEGAKRTSCACVVATLGQASDPSFKWLGEAAKTDPNRQLTLAFTSEGVQCANVPEGSLGASYWGFRIDGQDLVVLLESASFGKPITTGAVLPKPAPGGHVYLAPADPKSPYGKALTGRALRCKVSR